MFAASITPRDRSVIDRDLAVDRGRIESGLRCDLGFATMPYMAITQDRRREDTFEPGVVT